MITLSAQRTWSPNFLLSSRCKLCAALAAGVIIHCCSSISALFSISHEMKGAVFYCILHFYHFVIHVHFNFMCWMYVNYCFCRNKFKKPSFNLSEFQEPEAESYKGWQIIQGHNRYVISLYVLTWCTSNKYVTQICFLQLVGNNFISHAVNLYESSLPMSSLGLLTF